MDHDKIQFSKNLRKLIRERTGTQRLLAKNIGVRPSTLHNYLYGGLPRGIQFLVKVAQFYDLSLDELVFGKKKLPMTSEEYLGGLYEIVIKKKEA